MTKNELKEGYSLFGGKGDVWGRTAHIKRDGMDSTTLCGKPMLSTNWVQIGEVNDVGCPDCIRVYNSTVLELNGYLCTHKGKKLEIWAETTLKAQEEAARIFKLKKGWEIAVVLYIRAGGEEVIHIPAF